MAVQNACAALGYKSRKPRDRFASTTATTPPSTTVTNEVATLVQKGTPIDSLSLVQCRGAVDELELSTFAEIVRLQCRNLAHAAAAHSVRAQVQHGNRTAAAATRRACL
ncbi:hypothetical protein EON66_09725 [archaeon]|nr:MAG: hypothetical protein EON66_09725 [archaeon]